MNNSDLISALSLAIGIIIFVMQTDDGILQLKTRRYDKWIAAGILLAIVLLINHPIFERFGVVFYFRIGHIYLLPTEWALILFLVLISVALYRIFTPSIFNKDPQVIFKLIDKFRREKKWNKLHNILLRVMDIDKFDELYSDRLNRTVFNDSHLIEYFASDYLEMLIEFCSKNREASIGNGYHFFYILNGLFSDKSNPIYSEIRHYRNNTEKAIFLEECWILKNQEEFEFDPAKNYRTDLPIIGWLTAILSSIPSNLKEESGYFFRQFPATSSDKNNKDIYTGEEIERLLNRDPVFNAIQLFRIVLVEFSLNDNQANFLIDRNLELLYSSWDFIASCITFHDLEIALDNDRFTINEYYLKYLFNGYLSLFILLKQTSPFRNVVDENIPEISSWPVKQVFAKLESIIGKDNKVSDDSKQYYISALIELYFELPEYFKKDPTSGEDAAKIILWELKDSLTSSPYGDVELFRSSFNNVCDSYDFLQHNTSKAVERARHFYKELLPFTKGHEWRITQSMN